MAKRTLTMDREGVGDLNNSENAGKCRRKTPHATASAENGILDGGAWRRLWRRSHWGLDGRRLPSTVVRRVFRDDGQRWLGLKTLARREIHWIVKDAGEAKKFWMVLFRIWRKLNLIWMKHKCRSEKTQMKNSWVGMTHNSEGYMKKHNPNFTGRLWYHVYVRISEKWFLISSMKVQGYIYKLSHELLFNTYS